MLLESTAVEGKRWKQDRVEGKVALRCRLSGRLSWYTKVILEWPFMYPDSLVIRWGPPYKGVQPWTSPLFPTGAGVFLVAALPKKWIQEAQSLLHQWITSFYHSISSVALRSTHSFVSHSTTLAQTNVSPIYQLCKGLTISSTFLICFSTSCAIFINHLWYHPSPLLKNFQWPPIAFIININFLLD